MILHSILKFHAARLFIYHFSSGLTYQVIKYLFFYTNTLMLNNCVETLQVGDYYQLLEKNGAFAEFLRNYAQAEEENVAEEEDDTPSG